MSSIFITALLAAHAFAVPVPQDLSSLLGSLGGGSTGSTGATGTSAGLGSLLGGLGGSTATSTGLAAAAPTASSAAGGLGGLGSLGGLGGLGGTGTSTGSGSASSGLGSLGGLGGLGGGNTGSGSSSLGGLGGSTASDVQDGVCKGTTLICARGTTESGNMGSEVCPPLASSLKSALNNDVAVQGVNYSADVEGATEGAISPQSAQGAQDMAQLTKQAIQNCPNTKVVLAGYSQGAEQVHGAMQNLDSASASKVAAITTFGDPLQKSTFANINASKTKVYCAQGDGVCSGTFAISAAHLSYGSTDIQPATQFIQGQL